MPESGYEQVKKTVSTKDEFNSLCLLYRMTLLFFALSGLDVLGCAEALQDYRKDAIEWIYAQQILPDSDDPGNSITICRYCMSNQFYYAEINMDKCGFRGSSFLGVPFDNPEVCPCSVFCYSIIYSNSVSPPLSV